MKGTHELKGLGSDFILTNPLTGVEERVAGGRCTSLCASAIVLHRDFAIRRMFWLLGGLQFGRLEFEETE